MKKTEAVTEFLKQRARPELAALYNYGMECQVNVAAGKGERVEAGGYKGKTRTIWTDGIQQWSNFRIPHHANAEPEYTDSKIKFDLNEHCDGVGLTGWDWVNRKSIFVGYDFDAITGHSDLHDKKLTNEDLQAVAAAASAIPWVTVRKSTSGNGLHLYVFVDNVETANHLEHAALARSILGKMSAITGFDFNSKVDNCGHVLWIWHKKFEKAGGINGEGLKILKSGDVLTEIPLSWRDHIRVTSGARKRNVPGFVRDKEIDPFEELCGQYPRIALDDEHKALIKYLDEVGALWWFDSDHHMLVCHTADLQRAHEKLEMRGLFKTKASGTERGADQNCFAFPMRRGAWVVRRHTAGVMEDGSWDQDSAGWTRTYLNKAPDLKQAAKAMSAIEDETGGFNFDKAETAIRTIEVLGGVIDVPSQLLARPALLKPSKDGRLILRIKRESSDANFMGWLNLKDKFWQKVLEVRLVKESETDQMNYDDMVRHLITQVDEDAGWTVRAGTKGNWVSEPLQHVKLSLRSSGVAPRDLDLILGGSIMRRWTLVNKPFAPEYTGDREWNRDGAKFALTPSTDLDNLHYETWRKVLEHCGSGLDSEIRSNDWCKEHGVTNGGDYLMLWIASMFQQPMEPLPLLFFYGPQGGGKSIFHESLRMLFTKGVASGDSALTNQQGFNGELMGAVLCVVEETNLRSHKNMAYNRLKDWITGTEISIHPKGSTPFMTPNSTHWCQFANEIDACPVFPGDTRITVCFVDNLKEGSHIPKPELLDLMKKEAADFLAAMISLELPPSGSRLGVPVITTSYKLQAEAANQSELEQFITDECFYVPGEKILYSEFCDRFKEWLDRDRVGQWSKPRIGRSIPSQFPKGRDMKNGAKWYVGNITFTQPTPGVAPKRRLTLSDNQALIEESN